VAPPAGKGITKVMGPVGKLAAKLELEKLAKENRTANRIDAHEKIFFISNYFLSLSK
jgi:hypothetical protein